MDDSSNELHPDHLLLIEKLVYPVEYIEELVASQTSHVGSSYDLNSFLLIDNIQLRNNCKCFKPYRKAPKILKIIVLL